MTDKIDEIYTNFTAKVTELRNIFLIFSVSDSLLPTRQEQEFCKAFVILFHACLEDFFEQISLAIMDICIKKYGETLFVSQSDLTNLAEVNKKIKSQIQTYVMLVAFATFNKTEANIFEKFKKLEVLSEIKHENELTLDHLKNIETTPEYVTHLLKESKNLFFTKFDTQNHGVSLHNITKMLTSVGIDVNKDLNLQNSLRQIVYHRGDYAHRGINTKITRIFDKTNIENCCIDCLELCEEVYNFAKSKI